MPDVTGVVAAGDSPQEVERLLAEALAEHLEGMREDGEPVPACACLRPPTPMPMWM